ncbi:MAG TPA: RidA family protein [Xanthobacteraceae bacterium]|jgi:2-iminobutanoate/2-iminopropanoate deaminase|nr:RidA family protein [Xanthobacteraceae bacterium]
MPATMRRVTSPAVPEPPPGLFSNCLVVGDTIHISGQHAGSPQGAVGGGSMLEQSREAFRRVLALIAAAGGTADDVAKLNIYLCDMTRRAELSAARREFFAEPFPCSTLVGVSALASPDLLVEIDAVAVLGAGGRRSAARTA